MCKKGELLWEEKWEGSEWSKDWYKGKGNWRLESGAAEGRRARPPTPTTPTCRAR